MVAVASAEAAIGADTVERKPLMTQWSILLMNVGFFGIQYSFGLQQTAINPLFTLIGADPGSLPLLNLAGPITGLLIQPMIGLGIAWASMLGVPYIMAVSMVPKERVGVYMGILNMMIVIPMLIETVTFGWIFNNLLGGQGTNAIMMAGVMLASGSVAMLWVTDPDAANDSPIMPLATHRAISVYNRVVVGSDGSPSSLHAVATAAGVANAADAHLVVVSAYNPQAGGGSAGSLRKELRGEEDARSVLRAAVAQLTSERTRLIDQRIVAGDPASALLNVAGNDPANLIVVGNSGLGAAEGHRLGSVPTNVVRNASCDVLIVQSSKGAEKS